MRHVALRLPPIAVRLGAAFGLLAVALLAVTLTATHAFGIFHDDTEQLAHRDMRAVALAGQLGQDIQGIGRETTDHLDVLDGDLERQDEIAARIEKLRAQTAADGTTLTTLVPDADDFNARVNAWSARVERAIRLSRRETLENVEERTLSRELYTGEIDPGAEALGKEVMALQDAVRRQTAERADAVAAHLARTADALDALVRRFKVTA